MERDTYVYVTQMLISMYSVRLRYRALCLGHFSSKENSLYETHIRVGGISGKEGMISKAFAGH